MTAYRVDLRSDTVSKPSAAMRKAMAEAEVGDAWYGDDPTVNRLQDLAAEITGKEAALYVPTGTMANQIALALHVHGGGHLVASSRSAHVATTELMTSAVFSGIAFRTVDAGPTGLDRRRPGACAPGARQLLRRGGRRPARRGEHGRGAGGRVLPLEELRAVRQVAARRAVPVHLDGARLFNAAAAAGEDAAAWTQEVDTVMFCVSKGLGAPIGSLFCGTGGLMPEARRLVHPVRRRLAPGRHHGGGRDRGAGGGSRPPAEDHAGGPDGSPRAWGSSSRARWIWRRLKRTWSSSTRRRWGLPMLETIERLKALGVGVTHGRASSAW